ncbi:MAG: hypothetical protein U0930_05370 [Pirellulales bacterium]
MAIAFIITVVQHAAVSHDTKLAVSIAADSEFSLSGIQSNVLRMLCWTNWRSFRHRKSKPHCGNQTDDARFFANPHLIVVSTRGQAIESCKELFGCWDQRQPHDFTFTG